MVCYKGTLDLGANLALSLLDISETGVRLVLKSALDKGHDVLVTLEGLGHSRPIKCGGKVAWSLRAEDGTAIVGICFGKTLDYRDLLHMT